ncbi:hypothetical protein [Streptomyces sp. NPDC005890]|uniref:hypothetical protein n=1 Tax=Streptomyces sp. NPDC005890 TaxID=3154568 RepID=UPI0033CDD395
MSHRPTLPGTMTGIAATVPARQGRRDHRPLPAPPGTTTAARTTGPAHPAP